MTDIKMFSPKVPLSEQQKEEIADFLISELGEFGDPKTEVIACLTYAMEGNKGPGGLVFVGGSISAPEAVMVVNHTGMSGYIPEHILVYLAVSANHRRKGLGIKMMKYLLEKVSGGIALHVEPNNPARRLYDKVGFTNKYLEMRLSR